MARWLRFGGAVAAAAMVACVLTVRAQEADPQPAADDVWEEQAAEAAEHAAEAAEGAAERVAAQAEQIAERAAAQAEVAAEQAASAAEQAAEHAAAQAELAVEHAVEHSADIHIDVDPFAGGGAGVFFGKGPKDVFLRGPMRERRAADAETVKLLEMDRKLGRRIAELAAKYKGLDDDDERQEVAEELAARVTDQFTVRQQMRERELGELEDQVKRLRDLQNKRAGQIRQIVGDRVQQLLREADGLGWGDGGGEGLGWGGEFGMAEGPAKFEFAGPAEFPVIVAPPKDVKDVKRLIIRGGGAVPPPAVEAPEPPKKAR